MSPEPQEVLQDPQESSEELVSGETDWICGWELEVREGYVAGACWDSFMVWDGGRIVGGSDQEVDSEQDVK